MQELGQLLREARLEKGITLEEIQDVTKIRKRYLEAIEEGNYNVLPGSFYVRAFVKSYAEMVGLDAEQVLRMYKNVIPNPAEITQSDTTYKKKRRRSTANTDKWSKRASTLVFLCFLVVVVGLIWYYIDQTHEPKNEVDDPAPITQNTDTDGNTTDTEPTEPPDETVPDSNTPPPVIPPDPPAIAKTGTQGNMDIYTLKNSDRITVRVEAVEAECWYDIRENDANGDQLGTGIIKAGEVLSYEFKQNAYFNFGFVKAIKLTVNGIEFKPGEKPDSLKVLIQLDESNI